MPVKTNDWPSKAGLEALFCERVPEDATLSIWPGPQPLPFRLKIPNCEDTILTGKGLLLCRSADTVKAAGPRETPGEIRALILLNDADTMVSEVEPQEPERFTVLPAEAEVSRDPVMVSRPPRAILFPASAEGVLLAAFTTPLRAISGVCSDAGEPEQSGMSSRKATIVNTQTTDRFTDDTCCYITARLE